MLLSVLRNIFSVFVNLSIHPTNIQPTNTLFLNVICQASVFIWSQVQIRSNEALILRTIIAKVIITKLIPGKYLFKIVLGIYLYITNVSSFLACLSGSLLCMFIAYSCFTLTVNNHIDLPTCFRRINHAESVQQNLSRSLMLFPAIKMSLKLKSKNV